MHVARYNAYAQKYAAYNQCAMMYNDVNNYAYLDMLKCVYTCRNVLHIISVL